MFADIFFITLMLAGTLIATYTDLKARWVPDYVSYFLIFTGLGGHAILSILQSSIWPLVWSLAGAGIFYGFSLIMFYTGSWGGGDAKLLIGFGAMLPIAPSIFGFPINPAPWPFLLTLWINVLLLGAIAGLCGIFYLVAKNIKQVSAKFGEIYSKYRLILYAILIASLAPMFAIALRFQLSLLILAMWALAVPFFFLFILAKSVEDVSMFFWRKPSQLVEGDWLVEEIKVNEKLIYSPERSGISRENINKLLALEKSGKLDKVKIKEGLPYVPAFLLALLASVVYGDVIFGLINYLL